MPTACASTRSPRCSTSTTRGASGEWMPKPHGGRENLEAVTFLRSSTSRPTSAIPESMIAEESTAWPAVSRPTYVGGLGFGFKWDMGWMHDTLDYFSKDPVHRRYHHRDLTFGLLYAWNENFVLPLSHDEVVHGKRSLLSKMPGDRWQQFANLRALYGYMWARPGKKLLFMGGEFGQWKRMELRREPRLARAPGQRASRAPVAGARSQPALSRGAGAVGGRPRSRGLSMDRRRQRRRERDRLHARSPRRAASASSASAISRRSFAATTASACRAPGTIARFSTPTRRSMAAAMSATRAA